jgi:modification methylase
VAGLERATTMTPSTNPTTPQPEPDPPRQHQPAGPGVSVWATGQQIARTQRSDRYVPASTRHPARVLPAIAQAVINTYSRPGQIVLDPMCGIGTTLTEAIHRHRHAIGIEIEAHWAFLARANARHATRHGATGRYRVHIGDARHLDQILDSCLHEQISLLLTSPPYGPSVHGQVDTTPHGVVKTDHHYGHQQANLAHTHNPSQLTDGLAHILATARPYLAADATVAITARPWRHRGALIDLPGLILTAGQQAGLIPAERLVCLLAAMRGDGQLIPRSSFFQLHAVKTSRASGLPFTSSRMRTC